MGATTAATATTPDWSRERVGPLEWNPGRQLIRSIRLYQRGLAAGLPRKTLAPLVAAHRFWSAVTGADVPLVCQIEGGLLLPHPNGIVIHPDARIGANVCLMQQVTLGVGSKPGLPILEEWVDVGAGARLLGGIRIGAYARIGAGAVVLSDIPPGATAVGVPARVLPRD
ncbi:MAG: serine acetyltransferase [Sandaracinus sp.]|nr:serine acetyltransferase [Myxococcales bacterium]MCB9604171.1 serine acetyltransferase [Sandaracinus sp.]